MTGNACRFASALTLSLFLHLAPFFSALTGFSPAPPAPPAPPLQAEIRPAAPPAATLPLELTKPGPTPPVPARRHLPGKVSPDAQAAAPWLNEIRRQFTQQNDNGLFYPAEAIARGEEGEVAVFLVIDAAGQVVAARVEQSSGLRTLDEAALRAVRALRSLPADAPREAVLPVRFRLH